MGHQLKRRQSPQPQQQQQQQPPQNHLELQHSLMAGIISWLSSQLSSKLRTLGIFLSLFGVMVVIIMSYAASSSSEQHHHDTIAMLSSSSSPLLATSSSSSYSSFRKNNSTINDKDNDKQQQQQQQQQHHWSLLKQKLCPKGVPNISLGPKLFDLARKEFGLTTTSAATSTGNNTTTTNTITNTKRGKIEIEKNLEVKKEENHDNNNDKDDHKFVNHFYNGGFGFTVYISGRDPENTFLYVPIFKCANDQIHFYLNRIFNRKSDGHIRDKERIHLLNNIKSSPSIINNNNNNNNQTYTREHLTYNHLKTLSIINNANDTYIEHLNYRGLKFLFHKQIEQPNYTITTTAATANINTTDTDSTTGINSSNYNDNNNNNNDDEQDYFFRFNNTNRSKPCLFGVVRDPISHFLSGYNEVEYRMIEQFKDAFVYNGQPGYAPYTRIPINTTTIVYDTVHNTTIKNNTNTNTDSISSSNSNNNVNNDEKADIALREKRFIMFVQNVLEEHSSFYNYPFYKHFSSMVRIIPILNEFNLLPPPPPTTTTVNDNSNPVNDNSNRESKNKKHTTTTNNNWYLPTLDHLTETLPSFLMQTCPRLTTVTPHQNNSNNNTNNNNNVLPPMKMLGQHGSSKDKYGTYQAAKNVWKNNTRVAKALCVIHAFDYACYDFSSNTNTNANNNNNDDDDDDGSNSRSSSRSARNSGIPQVCRNVYEQLHDDIVS